MLIEGETIVAIGPDLQGDEEIDATGCYVMPGRHRPAHPSRNAVHGHLSADDFRERHRAALSGGTTMVVDFCLPAPGQSLLEALQMWDNKTVARPAPTIRFHMAITWWGEQVFDEMDAVVERGINTSSTSWPTRAR